MNLPKLLVSMFTGHKPDAEIEHVREAGREHGRAYATAYRDEFQAAAAEVFQEGRNRFLEYRDGEVIDVEIADDEPEPSRTPRRRKTQKRIARR